MRRCRRCRRRVKAWCRGLIDEGRLPIVQILKVVHPGENADDYEYMAIRALRRREDQLLNDFSVEIRARHKRLGGVRPYARRATTVQMNTPERAARCAVAQPTDQGSAARLGTEACGREMRSQNISHPLSGSALTARQSQVLETIRAYLVAHGYAPTVRELGALIGVSSTNAVMDHLKALERKGAIVRGGRGTHVPRRIQVQ